LKALLLAAGQSTRLKPLTNTCHKCLIEIYQNTKIIDIELSILQKCGIKDIVIVIGYFGDKIKKHVKENFPELRVVFIENIDFSSTNCLYSLWLTREHLNDDVIYMTADIIMDISVIKKFLDSQEKNLIYVNKEHELPEKDFKARIENGLVKSVGVNESGSDVFFCLPLIKMSKNAVSIWLEKTDELIQEGKINVYETEALNKILEEIKLKPLYLSDSTMEIDTHEDLSKARNLFVKVDNENQ
jgi:phosphoenolpyruvate phosphomutase